MRNLILCVAYDGTDFHGWQTQPGYRTVQSELEQRLQRIVRHPVNLIASGRTDAGVHAVGHVCNFLTESTIATDKIFRAVNSRLDPDLAVVGFREGPLGFHSTYSALSKLYRYRIYPHSGRPVEQLKHRYVYHEYRPLDKPAMQIAASYFLGTKDFKAFASTRGPDRPSYVRTILRCEISERDHELHIDVEGTGFLYNQVRNMVGTLLEVGRGRWQPDCILDILESRNRQRAGPTAAPYGLCLQWVKYPPDECIDDRPCKSGGPDPSLEGIIKS